MGAKQNESHFGVHFMVDGYNAPKEQLEDAQHLREVLYSLPEKLGMYRLCEPVVVEVGPNNKKDPGGYSGFVLIAESHISFHTFPNRGFVTADVYTCKNELDTDAFLEELRAIFGFTEQQVHFIQRGTSYPSKDIYT